MAVRKPNTIPPIPISTPMLDATGMVTPPWIGFFREIFARVGGASSTSNSDLSALLTSIISGDAIATLSADAKLADGNIVVDHPERFSAGQKVVVSDLHNTYSGYVKAVTSPATVTLVTAAGGSTTVDFSTGGGISSAGSNAKCYGNDLVSLSGQSLGIGRSL
jgi:hypothetical protein